MFSASAMTLRRAAVAVAPHARGIRTTAPASRIYDSILSTIGDTPIVKINNIAPKGTTIYAKAEFFNPLASVKDRLALAVIEEAERTGALKPGQTVVEATSGNTGIALAMVCAAKGYPLVVTMAESFSVERRRVMRMLGAKVVLTPAAQKGTGMVLKAQELGKAHGWFETRQFEAEANARYHANTTGPEILKDFASLRLDAWVTGYGTGGTLQGAGKMLKAARPELEIVLAEPSVAALVGSGTAQERQADGSPAATHPSFSPHPVQGWTPDFIPLVTQQALDMGIVDKLETVEPAEALATSRRLAAEEGIFTGVSGGGSMAVALRTAERLGEGAVVLTMLPDTAERYLSTPLFEPFAPDMNEEEAAIAASTPNYQLE